MGSAEPPPIKAANGPMPPPPPANPANAPKPVTTKVKSFRNAQGMFNPFMPSGLSYHYVFGQVLIPVERLSG